MNDDKLDSSAILAKLDISIAEMKGLLSPLTEEQLNKVPFEGSWTATHVTLSIAAMAKSLQQPGDANGRDPKQKVAGTEKAFLDFETKFQSPEFIRPEEKIYDKADVLSKLDKAVADFKQAASNASLSEIIEHPVLKDRSKYEIVAFVEVHTFRHLHQLRKIVAAIKNAPQ